MNHRITSTIAALALGAGVLAGSCAGNPPPSDQQAAAARLVAECTGTQYDHGEGVQGIANITYAQADWECNHQNLDMQVSVTSRSTAGSPCGRSLSGIVHGLEVNDKATGAATYFCDGFIRVRCRRSGCRWSGWIDFPAAQPVTLTAAAGQPGGHGAMITRDHRRTCDPGATAYQHTGFSATVWFVKGPRGLSHPRECAKLWALIVSHSGAAYTGPKVDVRLPWASSTGLIPASDGSGINTAWELRSWRDGSHEQHRMIFPSRGEWLPGPA